MPDFDIDKLVQGVRARDRRALARAVTLIESRLAAHREIARELLLKLAPDAGNATRVGITGVPGVGKSTFVDRFGSMLVAKGYRIAVLAVDPSSNRTRGSILGDKTRMVRLSVDPACFVRPSPTGGELGGVAAMTREVMIICEAAGFDVILVETVGVGQSENVVADMVDFFLALMLPGAGDDLQGIKKGIIEHADLVVINKADGVNMQAAEMAAQHYSRALQIIEPKDSNYQPKAMLASGLTGDGLDAIWDRIHHYISYLKDSGRLELLRSEQDVEWMNADFQRLIFEKIEGNNSFQAKRSELIEQVRKNRLPPSLAASLLAQAASTLAK